MLSVTLSRSNTCTGSAHGQKTRAKPNPNSDDPDPDPDCGSGPDAQIRYMAVSYKTTETVGTMTGEDDLGGWGAAYELFVCRIEPEAAAAGYDPENLKHKLLTWGNAKEPGLVVRFIHYFSETTDLSETEIGFANDERARLSEFDGTHAKLSALGLTGVSEINYF